MADNGTITHRALLEEQSCVVHTVEAASGAVTEVFRTDELLLEAPNWTAPDELILNGNGVLWRLNLGSVELEQLEFAGLPDVNNDHVPGPDGDTMFVSGFDWHIHAVSLSTGEHRRVTGDDASHQMHHFLHGVSPDGAELAFIGIEVDENDQWGPANIYTISADGGPVQQLTFGDRPADGSEYSPDNQWIYFNTEAFNDTAGQAQIARMKRDGSEVEQLTFDERVNWFPHLAPVGDLACYLSYPPGTTGHPENKTVQLKLVRDGDWAGAVALVELFGGQGTVNVNSWSPDGQQFAFVSYPLGN